MGRYHLVVTRRHFCLPPVTKPTDYGCFASWRGVEGLVHVSKWIGPTRTSILQGCPGRGTRRGVMGSGYRRSRRRISPGHQAVQDEPVGRFSSKFQPRATDLRLHQVDHRFRISFIGLTAASMVWVFTCPTSPWNRSWRRSRASFQRATRSKPSFLSG